MKRSVSTVSVLALLAGGAIASGTATGMATGAAADRRPAESATGGAGRAQAPGVRLRPAGRFDQPTYLTAPPRDRRRRFVTERDGRIRVVSGGRTLRTPFLDISDRVLSGGESGLLSMAFAPDFARSRRYYVYYVGRDGSLNIDGFRAAPRAPNRTQPSSRRVIVNQPHPRGNHKGGQLQFGRDGMLYAGFGDGGGGGDPDENAQDLSTLLGKLIRIDPRPGGGYDVPTDNPFAGRAGARGEIFAYGLRNPYRFSFDRRTGDLALSDVGQNEVEEVSFLPRARGRQRPSGGANLGWDVFEGTREFESGEAPGHLPPVIERLHSEGSCSITGGYVIRDRALGRLRGAYVYGDFCDERLRIARLRPGAARRQRTLGPSVPDLVSFGEDGRGRVYAVSLSGRISRLAPR